MWCLGRGVSRGSNAEFWLRDTYIYHGKAVRLHALRPLRAEGMGAPRWRAGESKLNQSESKLLMDWTFTARRFGQCERSTNDLADFFVEPLPDPLAGSMRQRANVSVVFGPRMPITLFRF